MDCSSGAWDVRAKFKTSDYVEVVSFSDDLDRGLGVQFVSVHCSYFELSLIDAIWLWMANTCDIGATLLSFEALMAADGLN